MITLPAPPTTTTTTNTTIIIIIFLVRCTLEKQKKNVTSSPLQTVPPNLNDC